MSGISRTERLRRQMVIEAATSLPEEVKLCRADRHWWAQNGPLYKEDHIEGGTRGAVYATRLVACQRCFLITKVELWRWHARTGLERIETRTSYDKAYLVPGAKREDRVRSMVQEMLIGNQMETMQTLRIVG